MTQPDPHFGALEFGEPDKVSGRRRATMTFENGYTASVITLPGRLLYQANYEVAVMRKGRVQYNTRVTNDVVLCFSGDDVTGTLVAIADLPPA